MTTWLNVFDGYDVYAEVFAHYPALYTSASSSFFDLYIQIIEQLPYDLRLTFAIFIQSVLPLTAIAVMLFAFFMPIFRRPQRWH